jgi:membrane protease subunit (stomatin/prohibitin family)
MRDQLLKVFRQEVVSHISAQAWPILGIAAHNADIEDEVIAGAGRVLVDYGLQVARMGNFTISIKPDDEEALKKYRRDVQYTKLAGSFQAAAAGEAVEGIGEGAAKGGGAGGAAVIGAGLNLGAGLVAASGGAASQVKCASCGTMNMATSRFCTNCGHSLTGTDQTATSP